MAVSVGSWWPGSGIWPTGRASARQQSYRPPAQWRTLVGDGPSEPPIATRIGSFVFEPDAAVLAASLSGTLAAEHGLGALAPGVAYLTADVPVRDAALAAFEVLEAMPYHVKLVKAWLKARGIGRLEVKKRGVSLEPDAVRRQLRVEGNEAATLLLAPLAGGVTAILRGGSNADSIAGLKVSL